MQCSEAISNLNRHQDAILAAIDRATGLITFDPHATRVPLAKARLEVARMVRIYQLFKHTEIYDPVIANGAPLQQIVAKEMKEECLAATRAYWDFTREWSSADVVERWGEYRHAMLSMSDLVRAHLAKERVRVPALLWGNTRTRQPRV